MFIVLFGSPLGADGQSEGCEVDEAAQCAEADSQSGLVKKKKITRCLPEQTEVRRPAS